MLCSRTCCTLKLWITQPGEINGRGVHQKESLDKLTLSKKNCATYGIERVGNSNVTDTKKNQGGVEKEREEE